jgi:hypothetical protein
MYAWSFSYTYPLPRPQGAGEGSGAHLARGGAAVPMPKQAQSHQGAPREYPEKNGPRGLSLAWPLLRQKLLAGVRLAELIAPGGASLASPCQCLQAIPN